jgi:16S rRNA (uracil1498-N3)-methyltransferase
MQLFYSMYNNAPFMELAEDEARHLTQVLRKRVGETVFCTDGKGNLFETNLYEIGKKKAILRIVAQQNNLEIKIPLHIAIAPTKNMDRFEWFLEKATEIGISEITPLICRRSERTVLKIERLNHILLTAMKQSLRYHLPKLNEPIDFKSFMNQNHSTDVAKWIAYCTEEARVPLQQVVQKGQSSLILIGPEGDFMPEEVEMAFSKGFRGVSLGNHRLRTETAGIVACQIVNLGYDAPNN